MVLIRSVSCVWLNFFFLITMIRKSFAYSRKKVYHLFFSCVVAKQLWVCVSEAIGKDVGSSFESISSLWLSNKRFLIDNMFCAAALWGLWKLRNGLCFQGCLWKDVKLLFQHVVSMLQNWRQTSGLVWLSSSLPGRCNV